MNSVLGRDVFWRYWNQERLEVIGNTGDHYIIAVYNPQTILPVLMTFLTNHLGGNRVGIARVKPVNPQRWSTALIFCLPQSKEIETVKRPFMSGNDAL